jgi:hypothetical protein
MYPLNIQGIAEGVCGSGGADRPNLGIGVNPYEGTTLPGYFYKVDNSGKPRPTLIFFGGYDSSVEELFYMGAAGAVRRGYNCLTFNGPGQGAPPREQKLSFRYDWEKVVTPAVDYVLTRRMWTAIISHSRV